MKPLGVITGASSGIGRSFAFELAKTHNLILVARRREVLKKVSGELKVYGSKIKIFVADLAHEEDLKRLENFLAQKKIDILINAAGFGDSIPFDKESTEVINDMIHVHVVAVTRLTHAVLPGMLEKEHGVIINVASLSGFSKVNAGNLVYNSTKAYLIRFSELLQQSQDLRDKVKVQVLCPGFTETPFFSNHDHEVKIPHFLWMKTEDVVKRSLKRIESNKTVYVPGWYNIVISKIIGNSVLLPILKRVNHGAA